MHDPDVVAFDIRQPIPRLSTLPAGRKRWRWSPPFAAVAGRELYWPSLITVWHCEPGGHDAFAICKRDSHWKWHVNHWRIQVLPAQALRRRLLTRCDWCGGPSRKGDPVNVSHQWDHPKQPWWEGEQGLFHWDCSSIAQAHRACYCSLAEGGPWEHDGWSGPWGRDAHCGGFRRMSAGNHEGDDLVIETGLMLQAIPAGQRDKRVTDQTKRMWREHREKQREASA